MGRKLGHLFQFIRWGLLTGAASMLALGIDALPAAAAELIDWGYDSQTRSLTLTLPSNLLPSVSVLASDQLLIAIPDTQIGDVAGLTVGDGVVDSIVLEQTTPETLWVIMEFAEGTVLADTQSVVPVGAGTGGQRWEVLPLVVASGEVFDEPVVNGGGAESLRTPAVDVAQADFPDLPILEPGIVLSEPVSVPPLDAFNAPIPAAPALPPLPPVAEVSRPVVDVLDVPEAAEAEIAAEVSVPVEVISSDRNEATANDEVAAIANIPDEPPFLGESTFEVPVIDETALSGDRLDEFAEESIAEESTAEEIMIADEPVSEEIVIVDEPVAVATPEAPAPAVEVDEIPIEVVAAAEREADVEADVEAGVEADVVPGEALASAPVLQTRVDASFAVEPEPEVAEFEPEEIDLSAQGITAQNTTNRWPDPIPFGVPLPR